MTPTEDGHAGRPPAGKAKDAGPGPPEGTPRVLLVCHAAAAHWIPKGFDHRRFHDLGLPRTSVGSYGVSYTSRSLMLDYLHRKGTTLSSTPNRTSRSMMASCDDERCRGWQERVEAMPTLSVVVPVHNCASSVGRAITSLLAQSGADLEIVVVDDGSTDRSREVAESFGDGRIRVVAQPQAGVSAARNRGVAVSRGQIVAFLDADDEVLPGWASALTRALADPLTGLASCGEHRHVAQDRPSAVPPAPLGPAFQNVTARFLAGAYAVRRSVFNDAGGFRVELRFGENFEFGLRLCQSLGRLGLGAVAIPTPLAVWHRQLGRFHHPYSILASAELVLREHGELLSRDPRLRADHHAVAGVNAARCGDFGSARRHLLAAARLRPSFRAFGRLTAASVAPLGRHLWPIVSSAPPRLPAPVADRPLDDLPTVTVVIACLDGGVELVEQVRALAPQLCDGRSELVLADNGSTDHAVNAAVAAGGPLVRTVPAASRRGQAHARNVGAAAGLGDAVLFLDQDDVVHPGYLTAMLKALHDHPFVAARLSVDALNDPVARASRNLAQVSRLGVGLFPWAYGCTLGIDRCLFEAVGGFDEDLTTAEDVDLCYRIQERYAIEPQLVPEAVVSYRFRSGRRQTFHQGRSYGRGGVEIYLRHRRFGLRPDPIGRVIHQWLGSSRWLVATDPGRRRQAMFLVGSRLGRLEGSLHRRSWYP